MEKAVIYARYSSHSQREESIEGQVRKCHEFAEQNGFVVLKEYCDRAISGKTDNRPEFLRMIRDAEKGQFSAIIMYTLDRFARNRYDSAMYKARLKKNGVRLYYTEQSISSEPEGIILESVLEGMAEYYSENLSRGVLRGMRENAMKGLSNGEVVLGLRKGADGRFEIDPRTSLIVTEAFALARENMSDKQIRDVLNEKGYRNSRGNPFSISNVASMLTNPKYTGVYTFRDVTVEDAIPSLVTKEVFQEVQSRRQVRRRAGGRMKAPAAYLLTGKVFCGHCGSPLRGDCGTGRSGATYHYYKCADRKSQRTCHKATEKKDWLERLVVEQTVHRVLQPGTIDEIAEKVAALSEREFNDHSRLEYLQSELKNVQTSIRNLLRLVEQGIDTEDVSDRLLDLNSQKADLQKQIAVEETKKPLVTKDQLVFWLTDFVTNGDLDDPAYMLRIIDTLVNRVFVFDEDGGGKKIAIFYNVKGLKSTVTLNEAVKWAGIGSDAHMEGSPNTLIPNYFITKNGFGIIIEIPGGV